MKWPDSGVEGAHKALSGQFLLLLCIEDIYSLVCT